jgi:hypothetical protein
MPVILPFKPLVVKLTAMEVGAMFSFEAAMIMLIIGPVVIVATPRRISIIGSPRIAPFVNAYVYVGLGAGGTYRQ